MVWKPPGVNVPKLFAQGFKSQNVPAMTFIKRTAGARTGGQVTKGNNPTMTSYPVRGNVADFSIGFLNSRGAGVAGPTTVQEGDRQVMILADTLPKKTDGSGDPSVIPEEGDQVIAEGVTYTIYFVDRDTFGAQYFCAVRK